jgi:hypothetical protein
MSVLTRHRLALAVAAGLYPDLQTAAPHHFTVQNTQQREYLRFSNLIANTGAGDLRLRPEHDATSTRSRSSRSGLRTTTAGAGTMERCSRTSRSRRPSA